MKTLLCEKRIQVGAFCSPQPAFRGKDGKEVPSRITREIYQKIADLGVTVVYGHNERIGGEHEAEVFRALEYCQEVGLNYFVRDMIANEYVSLGFQEKPDWRLLSSEQKEALNERFRASLRRYKDYPAFAGISFYDEPGVDSFYGIAEAQRVFEEECPDKIFYVNHLPNNSQPWQLQYGCELAGAPAADEEKLLTNYSNAERYIYFIQKYFDVVRPHLYSYDAYPFLTLGNADSMVHISLYDLQQICGEMQNKYGVPYWNFMQCGGRWDGGDARQTDLAEMLLQVNVSLAYGAKGIQLFPLCYPNDWGDEWEAYSAVFDRHNRETVQYHYLKIALKQVKACEEYLSQAKWKGARLEGKFKGLLPPEKELQKIDWNETIFRGEFPEGNAPQKRENRNPVVSATSQFFIGEFDYQGRDLYYVVNNSIATAANLTLTFPKKQKMTVVYRGNVSQVEEKKLHFGRVAAGDGIMILL